MAARSPKLLIALAATAVAAALLVALAGSTPASIGTLAKASHKRTYDRLYERRVSKRNKRWAKRVARCESGGNPNAIGAGGRYRGAFQFMRSTWRTAPRSPGGDPVDYSYKTQAFVAVRLKSRVGSSPWPSCP
ncbi:MAG TPA: transglycosylase family protein [Solirubrobacterales bacterium]|nr:transglycosylase family protein [Solirubrobacterales bacterium]